MKKYLALILLATACGGADYPSAEECGIVVIDEGAQTFGTLTEALSSGIASVEPAAEMCQGRVGPGQTCFVPVSLDIIQKNFVASDGGSIWKDAVNTERDLVVDRLNGFGWNVSVSDTDPNWLFYVGTSNSSFPSWVGATYYYVQAYVPADDGGTYAFHYAADMYIYKTTIMNGSGWGVFNDTIRTVYVRDIVDHEFTHAAGPPHVTGNGDLMSANAGGYRSTLLNPNATHSSWMDNYQP